MADPVVRAVEFFLGHTKNGGGLLSKEMTVQEVAEMSGVTHDVAKELRIGLVVLGLLKQKGKSYNPEEVRKKWQVLNARHEATVEALAQESGWELDELRWAARIGLRIGTVARRDPHYSGEVYLATLDAISEDGVTAVAKAQGPSGPAKTTVRLWARAAGFTRASRLAVRRAAVLEAITSETISLRELAKRLKVSLGTVENDIRFLKKGGTLDEADRQYHPQAPGSRARKAKKPDRDI